jgi:AcrR family transcriptional regulator
MVRWEPDSRGRLVEAALALFAQRGYESTTVEEIAERAGLSERTFFRYFVDKREVLFWGAQTLEELLVGAVNDAPTNEAPIEVVVSALERSGEMFDDRRDGARQRQAVIAANAQLRERELIKLASLASALAKALVQRGVSTVTADLAAQAGVAVFAVAFERWVDESNEVDLATLIRASFNELKDVTSGGQTPTGDPFSAGGA